MTTVTVLSGDTVCVTQTHIPKRTKSCLKELERKSWAGMWKVKILRLPQSCLMFLRPQLHILSKILFPLSCKLPGCDHQKKSDHKAALPFLFFNFKHILWVLRDFKDHSVLVINLVYEWIFISKSYLTFQFLNTAIQHVDHKPYKNYSKFR